MLAFDGSQPNASPRGPGGSGLEALTYVDGLFYAGHQDEGNIYVFRLLAGGVVEPVNVFAAPFGRDDVSGLHYDAATRILYAIHDGSDVIVELGADGSFIREFDLPGDDQEGITLVPDCGAWQSRVFVSRDAGEVWRYELYSAACVAPELPALTAAGRLALAGLLGVAATAGARRPWSARSGP